MFCKKWATLVVIIVAILLSACSEKLPSNASSLLNTELKLKNYEILSYQKAPYPENYPSYYGEADEVWCIVIDNKDSIVGVYGVIAHRVGNLWTTRSPSLKRNFEQVGCENTDW